MGRDGKKKTAEILKAIDERLEELTARRLEVQLHSTPYTNATTGEDYDLHVLTYEGTDSDFFDLKMVLGALEGIEIATSAHEGNMQTFARTMARTAASQLLDLDEEMAAYAELVSSKHDEDLQVHVGRDGYELHFNELHADFESASEALAALQGVHVAIDWYEEQHGRHEHTHHVADNAVASASGVERVRT